jgi:Cu+-exporting ATPase
MIELVKTAQEDKPDIQRLADKISAIFVPVVLLIALGTLLIGHFGFGLSFQQALMNSIAVLVISCPCAMGLATPTAVMVGVGRLAKNGILVKGGDTLELLTRVKQIVFDKTGTLTTGTFALESIDYHTEDKARVHSLIYELEKHSSHPIAQSLLQATEHMERAATVSLSGVQEHKGIGLSGTDHEGNAIQIGSSRLANGQNGQNGALLLMENGQLLASIHISDQLKPDAAAVISFFREKQMHTAILSGDKTEKTARVAAQTGVDQYYAEQLPEEKLDLIGQLSQQASTAMVGDGVNDAPALAKADIGIAMSGGSQAAIKSARIVLLDNSLSRLQKAFQISEATVLTIKQNLFWAFAYNIVAIPIAAMGFLNPMWGALFMAFSDVVVIGNSIRLKYKKVK